jgi:hypothetical protein
MSKRRLKEDSIYYRLEYARIARLLERRPGARPDRELRRHEAAELDEEVEALPRADRLTLSAAASRAINAALRELTPEQEAALSPESELWRDAARLVLRAAVELNDLHWQWAGRRPPWYVRWLGWRHLRRRREYLVLANFLDRVLEPTAVVLFFSCLLEEEKVSPIEVLWAGYEPPNGPLRRPWAEWEEPVDFDPEQPREGDVYPWLKDYLADLVGPHPLDIEKERRARPRPLQLLHDLAHLEERLLAWLGATRLRARAAPNYRVHYNLACLFSRSADQAERLRADCLWTARRHLELSLNTLRGPLREGLAEWAWKDPGLKTLRDDEAYGFERVVPKPSTRSRT